MAAIIPKESDLLLPEYLYYYLLRYKEEKLVSLMAGTANTSLTLDRLKTVCIEFLDIEVQRTIVDYLDVAFQFIDELADAEQSLGELRCATTVGILGNALGTREA
jgi:restriction endonuclease S subunit